MSLSERYKSDSLNNIPWVPYHLLYIGLLLSTNQLAYIFKENFEHNIENIYFPSKQFLLGWVDQFCLNRYNKIKILEKVQLSSSHEAHMRQIIKFIWVYFVIMLHIFVQLFLHFKHIYVRFYVKELHNHGNTVKIIVLHG